MPRKTNWDAGVEERDREGQSVPDQAAEGATSAPPARETARTEPAEDPRPAVAPEPEERKSEEGTPAPRAPPERGAEDEQASPGAPMAQDAVETEAAAEAGLPAERPMADDPHDAPAPAVAPAQPAPAAPEPTVPVEPDLAALMVPDHEPAGAPEAPAIPARDPPADAAPVPARVEAPTAGVPTEPDDARHPPAVAAAPSAPLPDFITSVEPMFRGVTIREIRRRMPAPAPSAGVTRADLWRWGQRAARIVGMIVAAWAAVVLLLIILYRWVDPPASTLMLGQRLTGTTIVKRWMPIERISPYLVRAVVLSEDGRFCQHRGVDWEEIEDAIDRALDGTPRGGSTITMQVAKNLFLWPAKSYIRKAIEFPLAYAIDAAWPKRRILEIYLNIAEWGPGVFGAEAGARHHFGKSAALLGPAEAALLAVALPNPIERRAGNPGPGTRRLAQRLMLRMGTSQGQLGCLGLRRN